MSLALSLATSAMTILSMHFVGKKHAFGWKLGLANQGLWAALIVDRRAWGLFILSAFLVVVYARNLWLWTRS